MLPDVEMIASAVAALALVLALILLVAWLARARGLVTKAMPGRCLSVEETIPLDPRRRLHLVRCGERTVLLMTGGTADVVVGWNPDAKVQS